MTKKVEKQAKIVANAAEKQVMKQAKHDANVAKKDALKAEKLATHVDFTASTRLNIITKDITSYDEPSIVKIQSLIRAWIARRNNIYGFNKKCKRLQEEFSKSVIGYHMVHNAPIKESVWEEVNCKFAKKLFSISDEAKGNHASGKDNRFDNTNVSNKSTKATGKYISISSYRLTTVCKEKDIIEEIRKRDNSFDCYSLLVRTQENSFIKYMWYIIPKDYYPFRIDKLNPKIGKQGKKKGEIVGWECKYASITFSLSFQLWYKFRIDEIKKYMVCHTEVDNSKPKINYSQIYDSFCNTI